MDTTAVISTTAEQPVCPPSAVISKNQQETQTDDLEKQDLPQIDDGTIQDAQDPDIVTWDGPNDPENPMNWTLTRKSIAIGIVSVLAFLSPLTSTLTSPAISSILASFPSSHQESSPVIPPFITSVFLLGYVVGPLALAPLSELYGRNPIYRLSAASFVIFSVACALSPSLPSLIVFRFLVGVSGSAPMTNGAGTVADLVAPNRRGFAMMGWILGPTLGPAVGPLIAAYVEPALGWRWLFWLTAIAGGVVSVASFVWLRETCGVVILEKKAERMRRETGNMELRVAMGRGKMGKREFFLMSIVRSVRMLFTSPTVALISLYLSVIYGYQYLMVTTFPRVFESQYGFQKGSVGLVYLGIGVGFLVGLVVCGYFSDRLVDYFTQKYGGAPKPEYRLPLLFVGAVAAPVGLFLYGWSAEEKIHWIVPIIASAIVGSAIFFIIMPCLAYLVDTFTVYAASATAAAIASRSVFGTFLPLAGDSMYDALGVGWGTSLLGFISILFMPVPFVFWRYGERIRNSGASQVRF